MTVNVNHGPAPAPPCCECGEPMNVIAWGFNPTFDSETATVAECDDCGIMWGRFTGYGPMDEQTEDLE